MQVLRILDRAANPLSAAEIVEQFDDVDRVTIYRTVNTLAEKHIIHRIQGDDRVWRYALGHAGHDNHHHHVHFACDECGTVECIESAPVPEDLSRQLNVDRRFHVSSADVTLHGTCPDCAKKS